MVSFVVIGNCQAGSIRFLLERLIGGAQVDAIDASFPEVRTPAFVDRALPALCRADYVLCQAGILSPYASSVLKQEAAGKIVHLANMYFRGLHPDLCYLGKREEREPFPSFYHSSVILDAFLRNLSEAEALRALNPENFERLHLLQAWETSLQELRKRDEGLDVPAASFVDSFCRKERGFSSLNHPTIGLMHAYIEKVLHHIGLPYRSIDVGALVDPLDNHDIVPIYDFVAEKYSLPYRTDQSWFLGQPYPHFASIEEMIASFYAVYRLQKKKDLVVSSPADLVSSFGLSPE